MKVIANPKYSQYLCAWAAKRITGVTIPQAAQALGVFRNDKLCAVAIYTSYAKTRAGGVVEMMFAAESPRWASKQAIQFFLSYPFYQLGCHRVSALIGKNNRRSRRLVYGIGFKLEGVARAAAPDGKDLCIYGLLKTEYEAGKFSPKEHGEEGRRRTGTA